MYVRANVRIYTIRQLFLFRMTKKVIPCFDKNSPNIYCTVTTNGTGRGTVQAISILKFRCQKYHSISIKKNVKSERDIPFIYLTAIAANHCQQFIFSDYRHFSMLCNFLCGTVQLYRYRTIPKKLKKLEY